MAIKIGHAASDERGKSKGGQAGDQTFGEVCTRSWYSSPWDVILRCTDPEKAEAMAKACEAGCANNKIGYDQNQRNTLNNKAKAVGYKLNKITTNCECDCSSFMTVCAQAAGINVPYTAGNAPYTGNMRSKFVSTGYFKAYTAKKYLTSDNYLQRGDILVNSNGHTAMALGNGSRIQPTTGGTCRVTLNLLSKGDKGAQVKSLQILLNGFNCDCGKADGIFGDATRKAVIKFQSKNGLEADGVVGSLTWNKLLKG